MSDSGLPSLDAMIERLKALGGADVGARVAKRAAPLVDAALKKTAAAGKSPDGVPWKPKKDGGPPLVNAAAHIATRAVGTLIITTLTGPTVFHHLGAGGKPHRPVIPESGSIPPAVAAALHAAARLVFLELAQGRAP